MISEDDLRWCAAPLLDAANLWSPARAHHRILPALARPRFLELRTASGVLYASSTANQKRTLMPIAEGEAAPVPLPWKTHWIRTVGGTSNRAVRSVVRWGEPFVRRAGALAALPTWPGVVARIAVLDAMLRATDLSRYRAVVIATQQDPRVRALILAARAQGVPVVYIPHAPAGRNAAYSDLPADIAALRGVAEVDHYAETLGAARRRMVAVGNPATEILDLEIPALQLGAPGVLAVSPQEPAMLRRMIDMIEAADVPEMVVAPHPRQDLAELAKMLPSGWPIMQGRRTVDLLREGAPFLIQRTSGVAWEAAALGVPTADVRLSQEPSAYPFLDDEQMYPRLFTPADVTSFVSAARSFDRPALRAHAREWCITDGADAVQRSRAVIESAARTGPSPTMVLDGWADETAPAWSRSTLAA